MNNNEQILSVSDITNYIKNELENSFPNVIIEGEISNYKHHSSGHRYFSLKDENSQLNCVMWKSRPLNFKMEDGTKVLAKGAITVFPPRGSYQLNVVSMRPKGIGDLFVAFEELKKKLSNAGYFDESIKKEIPTLPSKIGIATSPTGAAIKDLIATLKRRYPIAEVLLRPTIVQGDSSAFDIVDAIDELASQKPDLIIIGRGGGSIEDLWSFNTEEVANAIYNCPIPIISAVGHETDFTISDFVSDLRAATPTAAAELATPITIDYLMDLLLNYERFFKDKLSNKIQNYNDLLEKAGGKKAINSILNRINMANQVLDYRNDSITKMVEYKVDKEKDRLNSSSKLIASLDPYKPINQGYSILKSKGKTISLDDSLENHKAIEIHRKNEIAEVEIIKVNQKDSK